MTGHASSASRGDASSRSTCSGSTRASCGCAHRSHRSAGKSPTTAFGSRLSCFATSANAHLAHRTSWRHPCVTTPGALRPPKTPRRQPTSRARYEPFGDRRMRHGAHGDLAAPHQRTELRLRLPRDRGAPILDGEPRAAPSVRLLRRRSRRRGRGALGDRVAGGVGADGEVAPARRAPRGAPRCAVAGGDDLRRHNVRRAGRHLGLEGPRVAPLGGRLEALLASMNVRAATELAPWRDRPRGLAPRRGRLRPPSRRRPHPAGLRGTTRTSASRVVVTATADTRSASTRPWGAAPLALLQASSRSALRSSSSSRFSVRPLRPPRAWPRPSPPWQSRAAPLQSLWTRSRGSAPRPA